MRFSRIVLGGGLLVAGFLMANAVDTGFTHGWSGWGRGLWASALIAAGGAGVLVLLSGLGVLTTPALTGARLTAGTDGSNLTVGTFVSVYVGILVGCIVSAVVLKARAGVPAERTILAVCGAVFLVAACGRPWWLYATVRRVRWFALIRSDRAMRAILVTLGVALVAAAVLSKT
jgi:hypothetical protein